jgi:hypothetical protein
MDTKTAINKLSKLAGENPAIQDDLMAIMGHMIALDMQSKSLLNHASEAVYGRMDEYSIQHNHRIFTKQTYELSEAGSFADDND